MKNAKMIPLLFGDDVFGTHEYGWLPRSTDPDDGFASDDEDWRYKKHLDNLGVKASIRWGAIWLTQPVGED